MTAITLSTFRSRTRLLGDYSNSGVFTDAFLTEQVNEAIGEYSDLLDSVWEGYRNKTGTVATVASTATVALPADLLKARAVDILIDASRYVPLRQLQPGSAYGFDGTSGRPVGYLHVGANLELFPTPDAVYTIRLRYVPTATVLSADGDSVDIPNGWEGFVIRSARVGGKRATVIAANTDLGVLYGVFRFLRLVQTHQPLEDLSIVEAPRVRLGMPNHWDNLNRTVERGYAGFSLWDWHCPTTWTRATGTHWFWSLLRRSDLRRCG